MSVVVARREFIEENPGAIEIFMEEYRASVEFVNTEITHSAQLAVDMELAPAAAIAENAIPRTNIVFITGEEMRRNLSGFYRVLYDAEPQSIGGALPEAGFYFGGAN
jgi:NitT/TauT family transport system substrate-binding protein